MIIIGIITLLIGLILVIIAFIVSDFDTHVIIIALYGGVLVSFGISCIANAKSPEAIDVYRGKTTLQITYKGNIPIDTTVVYK